MAPPLEFWLYLPQMRLSLAQMVERARNAEAAGFDGIAGMDHLAPPLAEDQPMFEAMITTTWLAADTSRLSLGTLVLCDSFAIRRSWPERRSRWTTPPVADSSWASGGVRWPASSTSSAWVRPNHGSG